MNPDVALGMILRRLSYALHAGDFWQHDGEQAGLIEQFEPATGGAFG